MRIKLVGFAVFSLLLFMVTPAFADVTSVDLEKSFYTDNESIVFVGTQEAKEQVFVIIRDSSGNYEGIFSDVNPDQGLFSVIPRPVTNFFSSDGIYDAIAFTDLQKEENGVILKLQYKDNKVSIVEDFVLTLKPISDELVEVEKTISFTASLTDSSIEDAVFSLGGKESYGATIDSSSGKFVWTPTKSHGNIQDIQYIFDIVVNNGVQEDRETIIITVKQAYVEPEKKPEPKQTTSEPKQTTSEPLVIPAPFVDESKDPQSYVERYNTEASYKKWFDDNYSEYSSIYEAVGLEEPKVTVSEPKIGQCGPGTKLINGKCEVEQQSGGGCLIATAAYGSEMAPQVQFLREIRDNQLMSTDSGVSFMAGFNSLYYSFSPYIADYERENPAFKELVKIGLTPLLSSLSIMSFAESESEVLGYGIGVILMNLGMYVGIPAIVILKARKYIRI